MCSEQHSCHHFFCLICFNRLADRPVAEQASSSGGSAPKRVRLIPHLKLAGSASTSGGSTQSTAPFSELLPFARHERGLFSASGTGGRDSVTLSQWCWRPCALPCGHVFHWSCLEKTLTAKNSCPVCEKPFVAAAVIRLFPDAVSGNCDECSLKKEEIEREQGKVAAAEQKLKIEQNAWKEEKFKMEQELAVLQGQMETLERDNLSLEGELKELQEKLKLDGFEKQELEQTKGGMSPRLSSKADQVQLKALLDEIRAQKKLANDRGTRHRTGSGRCGVRRELSENDSNDNGPAQNQDEESQC